MDKSLTVFRKPNEDTSLLKLVAIVSMLIDHIGVVFFPNVYFLRVIGRIAFPLFCWCVVIGAVKTRNWLIYAARLFSLGIVSQLGYMLAMGHQVFELNVLFTLTLGLIAVTGIHHKRWGSQIWAPVLCVLIGASLQMDYGWQGVLFIILLYLARQTAGGLAALVIAFCLYWGSNSYQLLESVRLRSNSLLDVWGNRALNFLISFTRIQTFAVLSLPLMIIPTRSGLRLPKWFFYAFYPGHFILLWLIKMAIG